MALSLFCWRMLMKFQAADITWLQWLHLWGPVLPQIGSLYLEDKCSPQQDVRFDYLYRLLHNHPAISSEIRQTCTQVLFFSFHGSFEIEESTICPNRTCDLILSLLDYASTQRQVQKSGSRVLKLSSVSALHDSGCLWRKAEIILNRPSCWGKFRFAGMQPRYIFQHILCPSDLNVVT